MLSEKVQRHPILICMVFILVAVMGMFTFKKTSISLFPDIDSPYLMVFASYPNAGPESVEKSVTKILEDSLVSLSDLKQITSTSNEGTSMVSLEFNYGTDLDIATNDVRDKLDRVRSLLPDDVTPSIFKMDASAMPIMNIAIRGNRTTDELKQYAEDHILDLIEQADGVGEAETMGGRTKIVRVELEQNRLQAYGLTLTQVISSLSTQNIELGGGSITEGTIDYSIRTTGEYSSIEEINNTVIKRVNGYDVKLSDVGTAFMGYQDATSRVYVNGEPGVYVSVTKQSGSNSVNVANEVYKKLEEIKKTLPSDITLDIVRDDTLDIRDTIKTLLESALQGLLLAVLVLFIFLCSMKSTIIIAISIPLSLIITLLIMNFAGISLNMMTMTGLILGVGMIVDASIVMIDNIYAYRSRGAKPHIAATLGSQEMMGSVLAGNLTTICVFIPFLIYMKDLGFMGQMFKGIIFTIVIALVSSLLVAVFLVPVLAGRILPLSNRNEAPVKSKFMRGLYGAFNFVQEKVTALYAKLLKKALNNPGVTVAVCLTMFIISLFMLPTLNIKMMAGGHDDSVTLNITLPTGTTLDETTSVVNQFQTIVENEVKGYKNLITSVGSGRRNGSSYSGSIQISLPAAKDRIDDDQTIQNKLRAHFPEYAGVQFSFGNGRSQQMAGADIDIVIRSASLDQCLDVANNFTEIMKSIPRIGEPSIDTTEGLPQVEIEIDRQRAYNFGVSIYSIANEINASMDGKASTVFRDNGEEYTVYVMLRPEDRQSVLDLEQIYVQGTSGQVSVANLAKANKGLGPVSLRHENRQRIVHVTARLVDPKDSAIEVQEIIRNKVAESYVIPEGATVTYEGSVKKTQEMAKTMIPILLMAILLVFAVMAATYENLKAPFINLFTIPFLIIGVVLIYKITRQPVSMVSAVGLIMLVGIVVNNGIILVDYTNLLMDRGIAKKEACYQAGKSRFRPVLMTTLTTIFGMIPMCFATSGSAGMVQPIAVAVVGGLLSSTFVTLIFIPVLFSLMMKEKKGSRSRIQVLLDGKDKEQVLEKLEEENGSPIQ